MNRPTALRLIGLTLAPILLAACSATPVEPLPREMLRELSAVTGQDGRACFRVDDIAGYGTLNDSVLSVSNKFRKHYLLVTMYRCPEMETSPRALFKGAFTEFCGGGRDFVLTGQRQCTVQGVFEFENRAAAFKAYDAAIDAFRAKHAAERR